MRKSSVPEIQLRRPELITSAHSLIDTYEVTDAFFMADDNAVGLLLASALHDEATKKENKSTRKRSNDQVIADSFARTLFGRYSARYPLEEVRKASGLEGIVNFELHQKYTNVDLSKRLQEWLYVNEALHAVREIFKTGGDDFNVLVLSIGQSLHTRGPGEAENSPSNINEYINYLHERGKDFMHEQRSDPEDVIPYAYTCEFLGRKYICVMEPTARILLEPEAVDYNDDGLCLKSIISLAKHEFVHTQGDVALMDYSQANEKSYIGELLEEYRAEVFSGFGFESLYPDVYSTVAYIEEYVDIDIAAIMRATQYRGGVNKLAFYSLLISELGLNCTAKLAGLLPEDSIQFMSPKSSRDLYRALNEGNLTNEIVAHLSDEEIKTLLARRNSVFGKTSGAFENWLYATRRSSRQNMMVRALSQTLSRLPYR